MYNILKYTPKLNNNNLNKEYYPDLKNIFNILSNKDVQSFINNPNLKSLYLNKEDFKQFVNNKTVISITNIPTKKFAIPFYLISLIKNNPFQFTYIYPLEYIEKISTFQKECNDDIFIKIIFYKIIYDLSKYYRTNLNFEYEEKEKLLSIEKDNEAIIENLEDEFRKIKFDFNSNKIKDKSIETLYTEIIKYLIDFKFENVEYISDIFDKMDLEEIDLTTKMYGEIAKKLKDTYKIKNINDLLDNKNIINYHYILLKYVFKNSFLIKNISFFSDSKNIILKNFNYLLSLEDNSKGKTKFVINKYKEGNNIPINKNINNNKDLNNTNENSGFKLFNSSLDSFEGKNINSKNRDNNVNIFTETKINEDNNKTKSYFDNQKHDSNEILTLIKKFDKKDNKNALFNYIEIKKYIKKIDMFGILGHIMNNGIIVFIKEELNQNELFLIYRKILDCLNNKNYDKEECKTILEIPTINNIVYLTLFSQNFQLCAGKIIFDDNNVLREESQINQDLYRNENTIIYKQNGIFLVYQDPKKKINSKFSKNYEINYICPIYNVTEFETKSETGYFLTVGFEEEEQVIKLFEIDYTQGELEIMYVNDIILNIEEKISSIRQIDNGNIQITFSNGESHLNSKPNLMSPLVYNGLKSSGIELSFNE